mmetsp:Transcript_56680/g.159025  ORF Transcript_56680/g.159025 Transcript_56680/m.159025 type:complete len:220 (-) Transcript_56680:2-661(-)
MLQDLRRVEHQALGAAAERGGELLEEVHGVRDAVALGDGRRRVVRHEVVVVPDGLREAAVGVRRPVRGGLALVAGVVGARARGAGRHADGVREVQQAGDGHHGGAGVVGDPRLLHRLLRHGGPRLRAPEQEGLVLHRLGNATKVIVEVDAVVHARHVAMDAGVAHDVEQDADGREEDGDAQDVGAPPGPVPRTFFALRGAVHPDGQQPRVAELGRASWG